jgi:dolichol kinase
MGKYKIGKDNKTLMGSGMFLISAMLICLFSFFLLDITISYSRLVAISFFIALVSCITEAISRNGYDNLTIPVSVLFMLTGLNQL